MDHDNTKAIMDSIKIQLDKIDGLEWAMKQNKKNPQLSEKEKQKQLKKLKKEYEESADRVEELMFKLVE